jgi:hypothetical protein
MPALSGTAKDATGAFVQKLIRAYKRKGGDLVGAALSDATTGAWSITVADTTEHYTIEFDAVGDPMYDSTVLSLPMDTNLADSHGHTFTASGGAAISGGALVLDGAGDYLSCTSTDFNPGSSDFTLEALVYVTSLASTGTVFGKFNSSGSDSAFALMIYDSGTVGFRVSNNGSSIVERESTTSAIPLNTWKHVAAELYNDVLYIYVDGALSGSNVAFSSTVFSNSHPLMIGAALASGSPDFFLTGKIKSARFTMGARYKGAFTTPVAPYLEGLSGGDYNADIKDRLIPV